LSIKSISLDVNDSRVHALTSGDGPPIMLFHASPMNSTSLIPLINELSDDYTVIAVDTPGYGLSEVPNEKPNGLGLYAAIIEDLRRQLNLSSFAIYGTATGGQIAVRYALEYPDHVVQLFLDNVAHFAPEMAAEVMDDYFPDLTPRMDGAHLDIIWDNAIHLFQYFPWCRKEPEFRLDGPLPPLPVLHKVATLYLVAGKTYDWAYRAAFEHERREYIAQLSVPTTIFRWDSSVVKKYTDKIFEIDLPAHVRDHKIEGAQERYPEIARVIRSKFNTSALHDNHSLSKFISEDKVTDTSQIQGAFSTSITPEPTGAYLTDAWNECKAQFPDHSLEELNEIYINWVTKV